MTDHPTAPVQDDDAELRSEARRLASDVLGVFHYAEDAVREAVGNTNYTVIFDEATRVAAILERSRLSPTPETGLVEALTKIDAGAKLGTEMFEQRIRERKGRLTWYAVNVLQDNLDACRGTARDALSNVLPDEV